MNIVIPFLAGACMATFAASGVFFMKFWKASRDSFFLLFGLACWLIALERLAALFVHGALDAENPTAAESTGWMYIIRLLAFVLLLVAIIDKNRKR